MKSQGSELLRCAERLTWKQFYRGDFPLSNVSIIQERRIPRATVYILCLEWMGR